MDAAAPAALMGSQGGLWPVSDRRRGRRTVLKRTAKPCGPGARGWRQVGGGIANPTGFANAVNSPMTEAKGIRLRGERGISRKTIAQGMPECSGCTCMLVCASTTISCTRDRGCSKHPAFPAPSCLGETVGKARAKCAAGMRRCVKVRHPEEAATRPSRRATATSGAVHPSRLAPLAPPATTAKPLRGDDGSGLLRFARNDCRRKWPGGDLASE